MLVACTAIIFSTPNSVIAASSSGDVRQISAPPARELITFSCGVSPDSAVFFIAERFYTAAFDELGFDFKLVAMPNSRSLTEVASGRFDGECGRSDYFDQSIYQTNILRVDVALVQMQLLLWTLDPNLAALSMADISNGNYTIGYIRGTLEAEATISQQHLGIPIPVNDAAQALRMLSVGRLDFIVTPQIFMKLAMSEVPTKKQPFMVASLSSYNVYPYLHKSRASLKQDLERALNHQIMTPNNPLKELDNYLNK